MDRLVWQRRSEADRLVEADRHHRRHATIELAIRDLKGAAGLAHLPSGRFWANAAWLTITTLAHNLYRWIAHLGRIQPPNKLTAGTTIRNRLFGIPARLVNHSGRHILRLPAQWPWAHTALANLRFLNACTSTCSSCANISGGAPSPRCQI